MLQVFGCCWLVLVTVRLSFTFLFFIPGLVCLNHQVTIEKCGNITFSQELKNTLDMSGTFIEAGSSLMLTLLIFSWGKFSPKNFISAVPSLPHFWFWLALFIVAVISAITLDFMKDMAALGSSIILEIGTLVVLCCALKFIKKVTVKRWLEQTLMHKKLAARLIYYLFIATLWSYLIRNLALFLYDTSIAARRITRQSRFRTLDGFLLLVNCATRGSFTQFFYAKIFRNPRLPVVCENVQHTRTCDNFGPVGVWDRTGGFQPIIKWEPEIEEACRKVLVLQKWSCFF